MLHGDFKIGLVFECGGRQWTCTDVGTRVIIAVLTEELALNPGGPPYSIKEDVFDEYDFQSCHLR